MEIWKHARLLAILNLAAALLLPLWWLLMGAMLPVALASQSFETLILHTNWVAINVVGLVACLTWLVSLPVIYLFRYEGYSAPGMIGLIVSMAGVALFTSIQYYKTFLWPVAARHHVELVQLNGALVIGDPLVFVPLAISGVVLAIGYAMLGFHLLKKRGQVSRILVFLLVAGAILFGNGVLLPLRTIGLVLLSAAMAWLSAGILKSKSEERE